MRARVVRTPGELRDSIGHKVIVRKDWEGRVLSKLSAKEIREAGFHPKRQEEVYLVQFDEWAQPIAVPAINLVLLPDQEEKSA